MADYKYMEFNPPHPSLARLLQIISTVLDTRPNADFAVKLDQMAREPKIDFEVLETFVLIELPTEVKSFFEDLMSRTIP